MLRVETGMLDYSNLIDGLVRPLEEIYVVAVALVTTDTYPWSLRWHYSRQIRMSNHLTLCFYAYDNQLDTLEFKLC